MRFHSSIQKFIAALLVMLFTISFVPKSYFHDVLASHTDDEQCGHRAGKIACVHQKTFVCSFNDLVVSTPYVTASIAPEIIVTDQPSTLPANHYSFTLSIGFFDTDSRGPPAA